MGWVLWTAHSSGENDERDERYVDVHFACKGRCDRILESKMRLRHKALGFIYDGWDDIPDLGIPTVFITKVMALLNGLARGDRYEPAAFDKVKHLLLATFPLVSRHLNDTDRRELARLRSIPSYLGGMGYDM